MLTWDEILAIGNTISLLQRHTNGYISKNTFDNTSPWKEIEITSNDNGTAQKYAIWKTTADAYRVGPDGAVEDDPCIKGRIGE